MQVNDRENAGDGQPKWRSKKKFRSAKYISNIKQRGTKGLYGRGTYITDDQFTYFVNILDAMKQQFDSMEEKVVMANNLFEQTTGEEIHLSSNQIVCKVIEALIGFTSSENFERFQDAFSENLRPICSDKFASHVLQKMIEISFLRVNGKESADGAKPPVKKSKSDLLSEEEYNTKTDFSEQHRQNCSAFVLKTGKFLANNLEDFMWDPCANPIMRTSILCLSGIHARKNTFDNGDFNKQIGESCEVPQEWSETALLYANRLQLWPQFPDFPYSYLSSVLLSAICVSLKKIDKNLLKSFGKKILFESFLRGNADEDKKKIEINDDEEESNGPTTEQELPKVFQSAPSVRLVETLLTVAGRKLFTQLYAMLFTGRCKILAINRETNFAVQKLIENVKVKEDFETIFTELSGHIEELLKVGHTGVVLALSSACLRLCVKQGAFVTAMQNALHTKNSAEFVLCLLKPYEKVATSKSHLVHVNGSLVIQNMLHFNKPILLVNCILAVPAHDLAAIFSHPCGSHICDAFLDSKFIGEKSREKLVRHLEGNYLDMAVTVHGSRVVEKLLGVSSDEQKCRIAKELVDKLNLLKGSMCGNLLYHKLRLETYRLSPSQWKAAFNRASKAEELFKDIL